jgi:UDP-N-acetylmuramoylalanine--D-glutamate ligase
MTSFPNYKNKKVLILGLGLLGRGIRDTIFFAQQGAKVTVTDLKTKDQLAPALKLLKKYSNIKYVLGRHRFEDLDKADLIIRNADVPIYSEYLQYALKKKLNVDMDESLFAQYCPCPIIGITGTRGKTTTTTLIAEVLKLTDRRVFLAGNIMDTATLPLITKVKKTDLVVLELSSWQLQGFGWKKISPEIAVFTNLYPDHQNRYKGMDDYLADKKLIFQNQTPEDFLILNQDNSYTRTCIKEAPSNVFLYSGNQIPRSWKLKLLGDHNRENASAALAVGKLFGLKIPAMKKVIEDFGGVPHRLEVVRHFKGVTYINDTTSTTPISTQKALQSIKGPIRIIVGGADKKLDLTDMAKALVKDKNVKSIILINGTATPRLQELLLSAGGQKKITTVCASMVEALAMARSLAQKGDTVLLSPGCASFGIFVNEFDRGNQFKSLVNKLK